MTQMPRVEKGVALHDSEIAKRSAPGRLPVGSLKPSDNRGGSDWMQNGSGTPAAAAGQAEQEFRRSRPDLAAKRERAGK